MKVGEFYETGELLNATITELRNTEYGYIGVPFTDIIIVPTNHKHSSGWGTMKFLLFGHGQLVGCLGGGSDVVHVNGIGGFGKYKSETFWQRLVPRIGWVIDCLPRSKCLRLWCGKKMIVESPHLVCSDFCPVFEESDL